MNRTPLSVSRVSCVPLVSLMLETVTPPVLLLLLPTESSCGPTESARSQAAAALPGSLRGPWVGSVGESSFSLFWAQNYKEIPGARWMPGAGGTEERSGGRRLLMRDLHRGETLSTGYELAKHSALQTTVLLCTLEAPRFRKYMRSRNGYL